VTNPTTVDLIRRLVEAGTPADIIADVAAELARGEAARAALEERRAADRQRKARSRHVMSRDVTGKDVTDVTPPGSSSPTPPLTPTPQHSPPSGVRAARTHARETTPREELEAVLDSERAQAVLEHRQRIRKPLTARAARLLAQKLAKAPDPNGAADEMVANGWQGFEVDWLDRRNRSPPARRGGWLESGFSMVNSHEQPDFTDPFAAALGVQPGTRSGHPSVVERLGARGDQPVLDLEPVRTDRR